MVKYFWWSIVVLMLLSGWWLWGHAGKLSDLRISRIDEQGIEMIGISFKRKMVSKIIIDKDELVWVPGGYGWYRSGSIRKLLENENKEFLLDKMLLLGFGFDNNLLIDSSKGESLLMLQKWGWYPWIKFKLEGSGWIQKEENFTDLKNNRDVIDRIMLRDMADSDVLESQTRVVVYNSTNENGLAEFLGKDIERLGFAVIGWENSEVEKDLICRIVTKEDTSYITSKFSDCDLKIDKDLPDNLVEIYFGEKFAQMINYKSYVGTF